MDNYFNMGQIIIKCMANLQIKIKIMCIQINSKVRRKWETISQIVKRAWNR